jgi:hypothetical protein
MDTADAVNIKIITADIGRCRIAGIRITLLLEYLNTMVYCGLTLTGKHILVIVIWIDEKTRRLIPLLNAHRQ